MYIVSLYRVNLCQIEREFITQVTRVMFVCFCCRREFVEVSGTSEYFPLVKEQFENVIQPIYGPQDRALNGIERSTDRKCLLLLANKTPVGILVFKTDITEERKDSKYTGGCFVIKTLFVISSNNNNGKGYGSCLIDKAIEEAKERHATNMYVTVSESVPNALEFFKKKGFKIERGIEGKFTPGLTEFVLTKNSRIG